MSSSSPSPYLTRTIFSFVSWFTVSCRRCANVQVSTITLSSVILSSSKRRSTLTNSGIWTGFEQDGQDVGIDREEQLTWGGAMLHTSRVSSCVVRGW
jgi:hypothetical protein